MNRAEFDSFCKALPATNHVIQWGGSSVWKVGEKVFALGNENGPDGVFYMTFKVTPMSYDIMKEQPGLRPAPYLASRGMKWIQRMSDETMSVEDVKAYLAKSHELAAANLTKKRRTELGL